MAEVLRLIFTFLSEDVLPWTFVYPDEQAVRYTRGKKAKLLMPGIRWHLPGYQKMEKYIVSYQEVDCQVQYAETADGKTISFSANVGFVVLNAMKKAINVENFDLSLERAARRHLFKAVLARTWAEIKDQVEEIETTGRKGLNKQTLDWGTQIKVVGITDLAETPVFRVVNEAPVFHIGGEKQAV